MASGLMEGIKNIEPKDRLQFVKMNCEDKQVLSLFKHHLSTEAEKKAMRDRNAHMGHGQPKGSFDIDKFETQGCHGMYMTNYLALLEDPITEEQMMRNWIVAKTAVQAARKALTDVKRPVRSKPY